MRKQWVLFFLLLMGFAFQAQAASEDVQKILTPPEHDVSLEYLGVIFGEVSPSLTDAGIYGNSKAFSNLFEIFNQIALIVGIILIIYSIFVGTLNTAASGKILGEKWSGVWLPLRSAIGIAFLVPTGTGYCIAQIIVMWVVYYGVGGASTLWSQTIDYLNTGESLYSAEGNSVSTIVGLTKAANNIPDIFSSLVCNKYHNDYVKDGNVYTAHKVKKGDGTYAVYFGYKDGYKGSRSQCGILDLPEEKAAEPILRLTSDMAFLVNAYWEGHNLNNYKNQMHTLMTSFVKNMTDVVGVVQDTKLSPYKDTGWILAGNYYREISNSHGGGASVDYPPPIHSLDECTKWNPSKACKDNVSSAKNDAGNLALNASTVDFDTEGANSVAKSAKFKTPKLSKWFGTLGVTYAFNAATKPMLNHIGGNFSDKGDPFTSVVKMGREMMEASAYMVVTVLLVGNMIFGIVANICRAQNPLGGAAHTVQSVISTLVMGVAGFLYAQGAMLAIYLPLIPFVIFLVGVLGWFISVIEAMVAAPLVALGLIWPDAQNEVLGRAEPAMMLLLNLFLRPSLMIIGLIGSIMLCWVGFKLTNLGFMTMISTSSIGYEPTFGWFVLGFIYASLLIVIAKKCFSLVHVVPDKVLTWIGDHSQGHGSPDESLGAMQTGTQQGGGSMSSFASGTGQYVGYGGAGLFPKLFQGGKAIYNRAGRGGKKAEAN